MRVPCISNLNNKEMIIKDSLVRLKQEKSGLPNTDTGGCEARQTIGVRNRKLKTSFRLLLASRKIVEYKSSY